jgi:ATP-dependent DNA helicase PIF1
MILRNLDPDNGLCNGTRAIVTQLGNRVIQVRILGGSHARKLAFTPRITLTPSSEQVPFQLSRRQYPLRLAFAMTINKAQGQSVKNVGLDMRTQVFSHGQFYVAVSRCTSGQRIKILFPEGFDFTTKVWPELLLD